MQWRVKLSSVFLMCALVVTSVVGPVRAATHEILTVKVSGPSVYQTTTGTLYGFVRGFDGAGLANILVRATNLETGNQRTARTNTEGWYTINLLPVGAYSVTAEKEGLVPKNNGGSVKVQLNDKRQFVPDIVLVPPASLQPVAVTPPPTDPASANPTPTPAPVTRVPGGQLTSKLDATRRSNADETQLLGLPLADSRTFDVLATLAAGVAPPPQVNGVAGPGIGAGIGTAGQFAVNGQRARSNNFTVDGSDNNDEDVGVRRQGFTALVPQSIESVKEIQIVTSLWDAEAGRSSGSQVNAISRSGSNQVHGTLYDFFNHDSLNARNFFDYTTDGVTSFPLTTLGYNSFQNGQPVGTRTVPVQYRNSGLENPFPIVQANPVQGKDQFQRQQGGAVIGFPLRKDKTFFFGSFERQQIKARQEQHFSVPTVAQRGFLNFGASGFQARTSDNKTVRFDPTFVAGDAIFSLIPFPNQPNGPYGANTFTQVLPADAAATNFSLKLDHSFTAWGKAHTGTGRYNFTDDKRIVPSVGGAIFSSIIPKVGTQNLSLYLNSEWSSNLASQLRASYGRTRLRFTEKRDPYQVTPTFLPNEGSLLNAPLIGNFSSPTEPATYSGSSRTSNNQIGTLGQVIIAPFSPVGLDVFLFPQARANNTIQAAAAFTYLKQDHTFKFGFDGRRTQLNSFLNRNYRPQITFSGAPDLTARFPAQAPAINPSSFGPTPGFFSGTDLAALGIPSNITQALALNTPDSTVGLRFWQLNFFLNDNWQARRGLTFDLGLRYELNTVPGEVNERIEKTFALNQLPANDANLRIVVPFTNRQRVYDSQLLLNSLDATLAAYRNVLGSRESIYEADRNNFGPRFSLAWDPWAHSQTQAGKTVLRAGAGLYYDLNLGSVVSQSRNVFPTFVPVNIDANTFGYAQGFFFAPERGGTYALFSPTFINYDILNGTQYTNYPLVAQNQLNAVNLPTGVTRQLLGLLFNPSVAGTLPSGGGLAFTLPDKNLRAPYTVQYNLQIERELGADWLANIAYVGTKGVKLTRFRTPNGGPNSITMPIDPLGLSQNPILAIALPPLGNLNSSRPTRPVAELGAYTIFDSSAASNYHSLQASLNKRFSHGYQFTAAYTWSHAIDDVSDVFDLAGAYVLPQDDRHLLAERASANFDIRHRLALSLVAEIPFLRRLNNDKGAAGFLFGNWQVAALSSYQTGQPFTVNTSYDINLDGNLTDRIDTLTGLQLLDERQQRLALSANPVTLLAALGQNGRIGRNTFRGAGVAKTDLAVIKNFRFRNEQTLVFRVEAFNLWNHANFALPVRVLEAPSFGRSTDTLFNARQIQFALKYVF